MRVKQLVITVLKSQRYFQTPYAYCSMVVYHGKQFLGRIPLTDGWQKRKRREEKRWQWMKGRARLL